MNEYNNKMTKPVEKRECIACDQITTKNKLINNVLVFSIGYCQFCPNCVRKKINVCKYCFMGITKKDKLYPEYKKCFDEKHDHTFVSLHNSKVYKTWRQDRPF